MQLRPALLLLSALGACSASDDGQGADAGPVTHAAASSADDRIRCAVGGVRAFEPACLREVSRGALGEVWVIRHPDGGFRRLVLIDRGTRIATADGAEEVRAARRGADLQVRVADDRYLFAAVKADAPSR